MTHNNYYNIFNYIKINHTCYKSFKNKPLSIFYISSIEYLSYMFEKT